MLSDACIINPKTDKLDDSFVYIDLESVIKGVLVNTNIISRENAPSRAQRVLKNDDICFQCVRPYQFNNYYFEKPTIQMQWVASTGYAQLRTTENDPRFLYQLLGTARFNKEVMLRCTGTSYPAINSNDLGEIEIAICSLAEQRKIADFLLKIDQRINTQSKIIKELETQKKWICQMLFNASNYSLFRVSDIGTLGRGRVISTSEINRASKHLYPVYSSQTSNNGIMGFLDEYMFDGEYITWTTDGANAGTVFYRNGKFNCTNVCGTIKLRDDFDAYYISYALQLATKKYVSTNLANPKLMNNVMAEIKIKCPDWMTQRQNAKLLRRFDEKIETEKDILAAYKKQKAYLLSQMFI